MSIILEIRYLHLYEYSFVSEIFIIQDLTTNYLEILRQKIGARVFTHIIAPLVVLKEELLHKLCLRLILLSKLKHSIK